MFTLFPAFKYGWQEMQHKIWTFLVLTLLFSVADIGGSYLMKDIVIDENMGYRQLLEILSTQFSPFMIVISFALLLLNFFVVVFVLAGLRGVHPMTYLRAKIKLFPKYIVLMILKMIALGVGLMLFVVPGVILLLAFYFTEFFLIDRELTIIDSFKESWERTKGYRSGIFFFEVNLFIIGMFLAFPQNLWPDTLLTYAIIVLINIAWLPFSWNAQAWIYQLVSENKLDK